jgi:hypothetical protein
MRTRDVADAAGVSYRQIDYWCRIGLVPGQENGGGPGSRRIFTREQAAVVALLNDVVLADRGRRLGDYRLVIADAVALACRSEFEGWLRIADGDVTWHESSGSAVHDVRMATVLNLSAYQMDQAA